MNDLHKVPEHLPPLPYGAIYLGKAPLSDEPTPSFYGWVFCHDGKWRMTEVLVPHVHDHYAATLDSGITRHVLAHRVPDGMPVLPEGWVYVGQGDAMPQGAACMFSGGGSDNWRFGPCCNQIKGQHYATPIDSPLARKLLGLERRPAQEGHGTMPGDCDAKLSELMAIAYARGYMGLNDEQIADIQRGMRKALDGLERKLPSMLSDAPDLVVPSSALSANTMMDVLSQIRKRGYRIEWSDEHGLRGWKD